MFDILLYLFENDLHAAAFPNQGALVRKLSAAGFESSEIDLALDWLSDLQNLSSKQDASRLLESRSVRFYTESELKRFNSESRGFLTFLEGAGILNPLQREWVIDRTMALNQEEVTLDEIKWIALIVLWSQQQNQDYLFLEELLFNEQPRQLH